MSNRARLLEWCSRLLGTFRRQPRDREMEEELKSHFELAAEDTRRHGGTSEAARRKARIRFGGTDQALEAMRDQRGLPWLDDLLRDIRHAVRSLRRSPVFTTVALITLALGIGANTAMFSVVNTVMLRPLPYEAPEELVMLFTGNPGQTATGRLGYRTVEDWRRESKSFTDIAVFDPATVTFAGADGAERISSRRVSPNLFRLLGIEPFRGRVFSEQEAIERRRVVLLSYAFWQAWFGGADVIGTTMVLDGVPSEIIGILSEDLEFAADAAVWEPHTLFADWEQRRTERNVGAWFVLARLRPDVTVPQAQAEISSVARVLDEELPAADRNRGASVVPFGMFVVGAQPRLALWILSGSVFCVLFIAAANVTGLSLARSVGRAREITIRASLGASRSRIVRQLIAESVTLAAISSVPGILLAVVGIRWMRLVGPVNLPRLNEIRLDLPVLGWALAISVVTGVLVGLAPALTSRRPNAVGVRGFRRGLVVAEFAIAIILLAGAGLLMRSWQEVTKIDPGFKPERVLSMQLSTTAYKAPAQRSRFFADVLDRIGLLTNVESAAIVSEIFVSSDAERIITVEGNDAAGSQRVRLRVDEASEKFFNTIGTPLLRGRLFSAEDRPDSPPVVIINDAMARRLWPAGDPVGKRFKLGPRDSDGPWFTVVGVVADMRRQGPEREPIPQMFEALSQNSSRLVTLLVRTSLPDPLRIAPDVQAVIRGVDKSVPLYGVNTLETRLGAFLAERRFQTSLLVAFSAVALVMAAVGIYGLIHYSVAARTREIGIRMAVGAASANIFRMTVREGLHLSLKGLVVGLVGALWMARVGSSLLFGVTATDPLTFISVSVLLVAVGAAACIMPACRAMKVDPVVALKHE